MSITFNHVIFITHCLLKGINTEKSEITLIFYITYIFWKGKVQNAELILY